MAKGWHRQPVRHGLASKGIKTAVKGKPITKIPTMKVSKETPIYQGDKVIGTVEDKKNLWKELSQFIGTENYYKGYLGVKETDGVHYLGAKAGWLVSDAETIVRAHPKVKGQEFVAVKIKAKDNKASITYEDGNNNKLYTQRYDYAEIPDGEQTLFYTNNVLMLAGEY